MWQVAPLRQRSSSTEAADASGVQRRDTVAERAASNGHSVPMAAKSPIVEAPNPVPAAGVDGIPICACLSLSFLSLTGAGERGRGAGRCGYPAGREIERK